MKLGEIKIEALKMMYVNLYHNYSEDNLSEMKNDDEYSRYLNSMNSVINRCFSLIEQKKVLSLKRVEITEYTVENNRFTHLDTSSISDCYDSERISMVSADKYIDDIAYDKIGKNIVIENNDSEAKYLITYYPTIERLSSAADNEKIIDLPNNIACIIPLYIKSELYREEEPNEAAEARNMFELSLDEYYRSKSKGFFKTSQIYSQTEL